FLAAPEIHLYGLLPKIKGRVGGVGWWIFMPFELSDGGVVFVNRGFVPQELKHPSLRPKSLALPSNQVIEGLIRLKELPGQFTPPSDPKTNEWYLRDPAAFAQYDSLEASQAVAPVLIDQISPNKDTLPQPSEGVVHFSNNHLQYAFTWYALALVLVVMTFLFLRKRRKAAEK
ncbi:MAG: SURF1 family protein, partial [Pseudomonadota bacterium]